MMMLIVYVGAVAVLFLFVVMTLDTGRPGGSLRARLPAALAAGAILLLELAFVAVAGGPGGSPEPLPGGVSNTRALGRLIYTDYAALFELAGAILLVAMIGAIVLAHRYRPGVRRQNPVRQLAGARANRSGWKTRPSAPACRSRAGDGHPRALPHPGRRGVHGRDRRDRP